jgi:GPH family glycoside/pentoside/hexuronide:cation symporter
MATENITEYNSMKISIREKLAYSLGDVASNVVWSAAGAFLTYYYTNVVGLAAAAAGTIMLISRIFDGISDVVMGGIIDKTKSKFGKARPWLLWMAGPFALAAFLLFAIQRDWSDTTKVIYAFITYNLMSTVVYTAINLPYGVMNAMMTDDLKDRTQLNIFRMMGALIMGVVSNIIVIPLVKVFGNGNETDPKGWTLTFAMLGIIAACLFLLCFFGTKERIQTEVKEKENLSVKKSLPMLFKNKFWVICLISGLVMQISMGFMGVNPYFAQYFLKDINMVGILAGLFMVPMFIGIPIAGIIIGKYGKRNSIMAGYIIGLAGFIIQGINPYNFTFIAIGSIIKSVCMAPAVACGFAMLADVIDYHEWKYNIRSEGIVYSAASFGNKVGVGLGAGILGWSLTLGKFNSELAVQPDSAMNAILAVYIWIPFVLQIGTILLYSQYKLDKMYPQILEDLAKRREVK